MFLAIKPFTSVPEWGGWWGGGRTVVMNEVSRGWGNQNDAKRARCRMIVSIAKREVWIAKQANGFFRFFHSLSLHVFIFLVYNFNMLINIFTTLSNHIF